MPFTAYNQTLRRLAEREACKTDIMTPEIRAIAVDLDGTLLNSDHLLTPRCEAALRAAMARGVRVIFATGKTATSGLALAHRLGLDTPGVYSQGLILANIDGTIRYQRTLDPEAARIVTTYAEEHGYPIVAYSGMRLLAECYNIQTDFMVVHHEPLPELVGPLSAIVDHVPINKLNMHVDEQEIAAVRAALTARVGERATLVQSLPVQLETLPPGASKGDGLRRLLADLNLDPRHVLAIGDGENDLEMLRLAGIGVAMGNAPASVRAVADYVTASNDEDGVALAIERFVLNGRPAS